MIHCQVNRFTRFGKIMCDFAPFLCEILTDITEVLLKFATTLVRNCMQRSKVKANIVKMMD